MDIRLKRGHFLCKCVGHARKRIAVDFDAVSFHLGQNGHQRTFHGFINTGCFGRVERRFEVLPQAQGDVCIFGRVGCGLVNRDAIKRDRGFPSAQQGLDRNGRVPKVAF